MNCVYCERETDETYRVNGVGEIFCSDDCYDEIPNDDIDHPYIDAYEDVRFTYIDWLLHWESDLETANNQNGTKKALKFAKEMNETIEEVFEAYWDFYKAEGDDGVLAHEIYLYLLKFEDLQKQIAKWRPRK